MERFRIAFDKGSSQLFADRFHSFKVMNMRIKAADGTFEDFRRQSVSTARQTFIKSGAYALREATVDLSIMSWLEDRQGLVADFLRNSVGSVEEEAVSPLDVSYGVVERSWWQRLASSDSLNFGIRPFRTDPYAFLSLAISDGDAFILLANLRYYCRHFTHHSFQFALSVPLAYGFSIDVGTSYELNEHNDQKFVVKLFKSFKPGGILHVGFEVKNHPQMVAGIALNW